MTQGDLNRRCREASEALDRARAAHERRPDDAAAYRRFLEARADFLETEIARRDRQLATERRRSTELGRRLKRAMALLAKARRPARRGRRGGAGGPGAADQLDFMGAG
ncbi:hypothetical protein [Microbaculum marinisediminis]|uniref:Uncharacterized protein n=1 Tax=Microbaculum marinisediminis TaxID=2931392 RepID=A0AAW5QRA5_9HYPH|nr:hypothetical protein [Microbaculum sp. A6E488]MCT8970601.1 hypothetical protein [Microbaculum sp. A6E488]